MATIYVAKLITVGCNCKTCLSCFSVECFTVLVDNAVLCSSD